MNLQIQIGAAAAIKFAQLGASVTVAGRNQVLIYKYNMKIHSTINYFSSFLFNFASFTSFAFFFF